MALVAAEGELALRPKATSLTVVDPTSIPILRRCGMLIRRYYSLDG